MGTKYTGSVVPTLNNAPANAWTTDAEKACHVGELYLVDSNGGGDAGKVYAFSEYGIHEPKNATITDGVAQFSDGGDNLPMSKAEVTISPSQDGTPWISTTPDTEPYLYRALPSNVGNAELDTLVGGTVCFNQLHGSGNWTMSMFPASATKSYNSTEESLTFSFTIPSEGYGYLQKSISTKKDHVYFASVRIEILSISEGASISSLWFRCGTTNAIRGFGAYTTAGYYQNTQKMTSDGASMLLGFTGTVGASVTIKISENNLIDLTQMFGGTIANYIDSIERANRFDGVNWFRKYFPKMFYPYPSDSGTLVSVKTSAHKITGKNLFDPSIVTSGKYIAADGSVSTDAASGYSELITIEQATYIWSGHCGTDGNVASNNKRAHLYDFDGNWIKQLSVTNITKNTDFTISLTIAEPNARYLRLSEWTSDTNVMLEKGVEKTTYEAYNGQSYALDSDLELRGIPKLDANNNLYFDGDIYPPSGNVSRKWGYINLGDKTFYSQSDNVFYCIISDLKQTYTAGLMMVTNYARRTDLYTNWGDADKVYGTRANYDRLYFKDTAYSNATTFQNSLSGVYLVYELATETTESADPYTSPQSVSDGGTEEYVDSRTVPMPVGHRSYYANIVPITGATGANLTHTGVNLLGGTDLKDAVVAYMPSATVDTTNKYVSFVSGAVTVGEPLAKGVPFKENTRYTLILTLYKSSGTGSNLRLYYTDNSYDDISVSAAQTKETLVIVSDANKTVDSLRKRNSSGTTRIYYEESGIFEGVLTASQFTEYQGTTYNVTFTDQGTVYGGTYDFVNGVLSITHKSIDLGDISWTRSTAGTYPFFYGTITGETAVATADVITCMSDRFEAKVNTTISNFRGTNYDGKICFQYAQAATIMVQDSGYDDANSFTEAVTGSQFVFELASPQTYTLTPNVINSVLGLNYVWTTIGTLSGVGYLSDNMIMTYGWLETWTMPKITKSNGTVVVLPYPQEYTPEIYDVDAATTGRNAAGTMIRDRVARKHKFNYKWAALSQTELSEILGAIQGVSFTLTTADPETGAKTNYTVYPGNRSMPVYWYPTPQSTSWMYASLSANLIEM